MKQSIFFFVTILISSSLSSTNICVNFPDLLSKGISVCCLVGVHGMVDH